MDVVGVRLWLPTCVLVGLFALPVSAQSEPTPTDARQLFEEGVAALQAEQYEEAVGLLRESFDLTQRPAIAFNLGLALHRSGAALQAMEIVEPLMEGEFGEVDSSRRPEVEQLSRQLRAHLGRVAVRLEDVARAELFVDEQTRGTLRDGRELTLWVEPGEHAIVAVTEEGDRVRERVSVEGADRVQVVLHLPSVIREIVERDTSQEESGSALPWLLGVGGVLLAAGVGVALIILLAPEETVDPIYGRTETLTWKF